MKPKRSCSRQVHTADGRLISGSLTCLDKQGNIVLQHAAQHLEHSIEERHLGTAIVPKKQRMKTEAMVSMHLHPCTHGAMGNSEMCPLHSSLRLGIRSICKADSIGRCLHAGHEERGCTASGADESMQLMHGSAGAAHEHASIVSTSPLSF